MKQAILVHNPGAGDGKCSAEQLLEWLGNAGIRARYLDAKKRKELKKLKRAKGLVIVAGGDGTVGKVSRRVAGRDVQIAVLPLGTANNIARSLGFDGEPQALIAGLKRARRLKVDVGIAKGPWGERVLLEGIGAGLFADVMAALDSGRKPRRRRKVNGASAKLLFGPEDKHLEAPLHALAEALPRYKAKATHVSVDGREISGSFLLVEALNMPFLGPNLHLGPDADPSDGQLDIVLLGEDDRAEFEGYLQHRLEGGDDAPMLRVVKGKRLRFEWNGDKLHVDDKVVSMHDPDYDGDESNVVKVRIERAALEFVIPRVKTAAAPPRRAAAPEMRRLRRGKTRVVEAARP